MFSFWKMLIVPVVVVGSAMVAAPQSAEAQGFGMSIYSSGNPGYYGSPYNGGYGSYGPYGAYGGGYGSYRANYGSPYGSFYGYGVPYGGYHRGHHHHHHHHHRY